MTARGNALRVAGLCAVALLSLLACADDASRRQSSAANGDTPERVISLIPSATEMILALGAAERLVARTEYDQDPRLESLPSVGRGLTPSLEHLISLRPDLVVTWPDNASRTLNTRLAELGVTVYAPESQSLADIFATVRRLGELLDRETEADSLRAAMRARLAAIGLAVAGRERPPVLYAIWHEPPAVAGPGTYIDELVEIAGGHNIFHDASGLWPQVSIEEVVRRDPDIIILPVSDENPLAPELLRAASGWRQVRAVREDRIATVDGDLFNRPGPRVVEAAERLVEILHPRALQGMRP